MKTVSRNLPEKKFEIEKLPNGKCNVLFYENVERNEFKQRYEYDLYRFETVYRPALYKIVESDYDKWLDLAKNEENKNVPSLCIPSLEDSVKEIENSKVDIDDLFKYIVMLEKRIMEMELEIDMLKNPKQIRLRHRMDSHYELSPYEKVKRLILNNTMTKDEILGIITKFVDNKYMTEDEFSELFDMLEERYGGE